MHWDSHRRRRAIADRSSSPRARLAMTLPCDAGVGRVAHPRRAARPASTPDIRNLVYRVGRRRSAAASRAPEGAVRLHVPDLRRLGVDSAVALRQQPRHAGRRRRRRHDRRATRSGSCCGATTRACRPSAWRRMRDRRTQPLQLDGQLPGLPHGGDRRRRLLRRRHEDVRRALARRRAEAADERPRGAAWLRARIRPTTRCAADANRILNSHHHDKIDSLTRARSTAFAASHVEMYMRPHDGAMPAVERRRPRRREDAAALAHGGQDAGRALVHRRQLPRPVPADGLVDGARKGSVVRRAGAASSCPTIKDGVRVGRSSISGRRAIRTQIDRALAARGRELFYSEEIGCSRCHGVYDGSGNVDWPGVHADVGTDRARLDVVSDEFIDAFDSSPLAAEGALRKSEGYAATPLTGVWANFPVPAQRQRADAAPPARARRRSGRRSSRSWRPPARSRARRPAALRRSRVTPRSAKRSSCAASATIATGSTRRGRARQRRPRLLVADPERTRIAGR